MAMALYFFPNRNDRVIDYRFCSYRISNTKGSQGLLNEEILTIPTGFIVHSLELSLHGPHLHTSEPKIIVTIPQQKKTVYSEEPT